MPRLNRAEVWRFVQFLFFSLSAGLIEMGAFSLLHETTGWTYWPSYLIALTLSVVWNFTLNRRFTFKSAARVSTAMLKVVGYYLVFTPLSTWLGEYLTVSLAMNGYLVTAINMVLNFVTEFLFQRFFVFKNSINTRAPASGASQE